ncbi:DMT family transporter [Streptomyces aidingensis]|uniref:Permease of the drug/metabolite transporter (DMT) superfamily n=1 Tax=Streptomyces aidingensis TaxID=910347 RepID=A0A1I1QKF9_9ACTN|nr:DMT family transporter [Streptomyces aidingensis]SFD20318.1 Permease of the drug/metabolite transporter (DMT) superfamily [Streptomyces aidingensis]
MDGKPVWQGAFYGAGAMALAGSSAAVLAGLSGYPALGGQALRYAGAAAVLLLVLRLRRIGHLRPTGPELARLTVVAGTGLAGFNVCYVQAVRHADPASVGAVIGALPVVLAVLDPLLRRRAPRPRLVLASLVVTGGVALTQGLGGGSPAGLAWALGALAGEVAFSLVAVALLPRYGPLRVSAYASVLAVPLLLGAALALDGRGALPVPTAGQLGYFLYLSVAVTALAFVLWYAAVARLGAARAGLCAGVAPASAVAAAWLLGTGSPTLADVAGAALVGLGVTAGLAGGGDGGGEDAGEGAGGRRRPRGRTRPAAPLRTER